ncbi:MAG: hypothetical protein ACM3MK_13000 [Chitinophagales bacterium]
MKYKSLLACFLTFFLLLFVNSANLDIATGKGGGSHGGGGTHSQGEAKNNGNDNTPPGQVDNENSQKTEEKENNKEKEKKDTARKEKLQVCKEKKQTVKQNRATITGLVQQVRTNSQELKNSLVNTQKDKPKLTKQQLAEVKQCLQKLKDDRKALQENFRVLKQENESAIKSGQDGNLDARIDSMNKIISLQEERIRLLNQLLDDIKNIQELV